MGLFGGSDSNSEDEEEETDLSEYQTSSVNSYISDKVSKETDSTPESAEGTKSADENSKSTDKSEPSASTFDSERVESLVSKREHCTVTKERITGTLDDDGYTNTPVINHIKDSEDILAIVRGGSYNSVKYGYDNVSHNTKEKTPVRGGEIVYVPTDQRLFIIIPEDEQDITEEIQYGEIREIKGDTQSGFLETGYVFEIFTSGPKYRLELRDSPYSTSLIDIVREKSSQDCEFVVTSPQYDNSDQIEVIDRETGEAKMESKGWNYGIGFIERTKSDAVIEKEGYEMDAIEIIIKSEHLMMEATQPKGERVTMRRQYDDIGGVDETSRGFIVYCSDGIYKFSYGTARSRHSDRKSKMQTAIRKKVEKGKSKAENEDKTEGGSELEKLEKLAELKEKGVLTEEEFKEKKQDLLDEI